MCPRSSPGGGVQRPARPGHRDRVGSRPRHGGTAALRAADVAAPGQAAGHGGALGNGGAGVWWRRGWDGGWNGRNIWKFLGKVENHHVFLDVFRVFSMFFQWFCWFVGAFWSRDMLKHSKFFYPTDFWTQYYNWLVVWTFFSFSIYREESSQLTNSYFSELWLNHQPDNDCIMCGLSLLKAISTAAKMPKDLHHKFRAVQPGSLQLPPDVPSGKFHTAMGKFQMLIYRNHLPMNILENHERVWKFMMLPNPWNSQFTQLEFHDFHWVFRVYQTSAGEDEDDEDLTDLPPLRCIRPKMTAESKFQIGQKADMGDRLIDPR